jgi:hypothetical protein
MAHDNQYKDNEDAVCRVMSFDYPRKGESYWNRITHRVEVADKDLDEKFLILNVEDK